MHEILVSTAMFVNCRKAPQVYIIRPRNTFFLGVIAENGFSAVFRKFRDDIDQNSAAKVKIGRTTFQARMNLPI